MNTKTQCKTFNESSELQEWIDEMYKKYGKRVINVSTSAFAWSMYSIYFIGFITILQEEQTNNID